MATPQHIRHGKTHGSGQLFAHPSAQLREVVDPSSLAQLQAVKAVGLFKVKTAVGFAAENGLQHGVHSLAQRLAVALRQVVLRRTKQLQQQRLRLEAFAELV